MGAVFGAVYFIVAEELQKSYVSNLHFPITTQKNSPLAWKVKQDESSLSI